jgi:hypothetical protein
MASRRMSPVGAARRRSYRRLLLLASAVVLIAMHGTAMSGAKPDAAALVIAGPGDEVALSFDAAAAGTPPPGWERTYLLQADGFSKEMDLHSVSPDAVGPLPFRAMRQYPPAPGEATPHDTAEGTAASRSVVRAIPRLESLLVPD